MNSIQKLVENTIEINKSTFINIVAPVTSIEEATTLLQDLKNTYNDATHHCYAYIIGDNQEIQKYSDDGEPSKTAGMPMLEVLKKHDLTNIINVSVRYFGGIKLGAGGLVRAYTKSCSEALKKTTLTSLIELSKVEVIVSFNDIGKVEKHIRDNYTLIDTTYDTHVHYIIEVEKLKESILKAELTEYTNGNSDFKRLMLYKEYR